MDRPRLAVVVPCHNEAATVGGVVAAARAHGEVFVVDDRSTDGSAAAAEAAGATVLRAQAPGYDGALTTGLGHAHGQGFDLTVTMDADGEHDPGALADFVRAREGGAGLVCGVRRRPQRWAEAVVAGLARRRFGLSDPFCGMKGYGREALELWAASGAPLHVNLTPALLWRRRGGAYAEVPVGGEARRDRPRFGRALAANVALLRAYLAAARVPVPEAACAS